MNKLEDQLFIAQRHIEFLYCMCKEVIELRAYSPSALMEELEQGHANYLKCLDLLEEEFNRRKRK